MSDQPIRFSHLRAYGRSGMHGKLARETGEEEETVAMERGTAVHALLFGTKKVCGYPGPVRRGKDYDAFALEHADYEILTQAEYDKARAMADAVLASSLAMSVLAGVAEQTLLFRWIGRDCRSTPDVRGNDFITELKTTANADPVKFQWHSLRMHYHAQMAFERLATHALGTRAQRCYLVAVESKPPYPVSVFEFTEHALIDGEKLLSLWMERLMSCEASNQYPPYCSSIVELDTPEEVDYDFGQEEE